MFDQLLPNGKEGVQKLFNEYFQTFESLVLIKLLNKKLVSNVIRMPRKTIIVIKEETVALNGEGHMA